MGIYDRDYYRREGPSFLGAITSTGQVCKWLILINVVLFVIQVATQKHVQVLQDGKVVTVAVPSEFTQALTLNIDEVMQGQVWRLLTHAFLHGGLWHIFFNMLFLWWFGSEVEDLYGSKEFLAFYLVSAVVAGLAFVLAGLSEIQRSGSALGASGAVTAVMVLFALHYPTRRIYIWFVLPVPVWLLVVFQVAQDAFGLLTDKPGVGWSAHLGGAAFGFLYYKMQWRILNFLPSLGGWQRARARPRLRVYREEEAEERAPVPAATSTSADVDEQLEAKMDAILEKWARHGKDSLTESEHQILKRASEKLRERRRD